MVTDRERENETELPPLPPPASEVSEKSRDETLLMSDGVNNDTLSYENDRSANAKGNISATTATVEGDAPINEMTPLCLMPTTANSVTTGADRNRSDRLEDGTDEFGDMDDLCEVVLSFKCRHCSFLCQDKRKLSVHIKNTHGPNANKLQNAVLKFQIDEVDEQHGMINKRNFEGCFGGNYEKSNGLDEGESLICKNGVQKVELSPTPSIPATPDALVVDDSMSCHEDDAVGIRSEDRYGIDDQVEDVFLCAECDIVFASKELCCSHMHEVHDLTQFNADFIQDEIIAKKPSSENPLPKQRRTRPPKHLTSEGGAVVPKRFRVTKDVFYTCSKCPIRFESNEVMKFHEQSHTKEEPAEDSSKNLKRGGFVCPVCESKSLDSPEVFAKWGPCAGHLWREHKIDCELYTCSVCKQFKSNLITRVKEHERLHMTQAVYLCKTCKKTFKQLKQLRCHEKFHKEKMTKLPPPTDARWYTPKECHICKRILSDAKCLKKHISAVHNKLKPYCCNICGHMTARKAELQLHMRIHTQEKPYKCPFCAFNTGDHNSLRKHKLRHTDMRPYVCPYCDYRCIQSCAFKKHILAVHPGQEVVFVCQLCSHASVNEVLFAAHQKDHAEGRLPSEIQNELNNSSESLEKESIEVDNPSATSSSGLDSLKKSSQPIWLEEDSVDVVDTGGVTIPASPVEPESREELDPEFKKLARENAKVILVNGTNAVNEAVTPGLELSQQDKGVQKSLLDSTRSIVNPAASSGGLIPPPQTHSSGQTTYILLPPNTPLPFITSTSFPLVSPRPTALGTNQTLVDSHVQVQVSSQSTSKGISDKSFNGVSTATNTNHRPTGSFVAVMVQKDKGAVLSSSYPGSNDKDTNARVFTPFISTSNNSNEIIEAIPHLDALDVAEVINAFNQPTSSNDSMFEKLLGLSGI